MSKADELKSKNENLFERNPILLNENERLKKENAELEKRLVFARAEFQRQYKENEELRNNGFTVSAMTEQQLKVALEKGEQLEKENAELSMKRKAERKIFQGIVEKKNDQLVQAKEIIKNLLILKKDQHGNTDIEWRVEVTEQAEQFLKEIEK